MTEDAPKPPQPKPPPADAGHIPMTEEMDSARWTLPPIVPLLIAAAAVALVAGGYYWLGKAKPVSSGAIREVVAAEQPDKASVMVLVRLVVENKGETPFWVRATRVSLKTSQGEWTDEAASAVDHDRYFQAFPELAAHRGPALPAETRIPAGTNQEGMVMVSFPVTKQAFDQRQSLTVTVDAYDQPSLILKQ
ncbi:MAG: hypothetical protein M3O85_06395 [Acidobacteriota bacterium]|nr:hypothetical protein [Acidobacteriota bacterium]